MTITTAGTCGTPLGRDLWGDPVGAEGECGAMLTARAPTGARRALLIARAFTSGHPADAGRG